MLLSVHIYSPQTKYQTAAAVQHPVPYAFPIRLQWDFCMRNWMQDCSFRLKICFTVFLQKNKTKKTCTNALRSISMI